MDFLNCKKIDTSISRARKMLIEKANKNGIYECFGQKEVGIIKDKFIDISDYSNDMNNNRRKINEFDDWCSSYTGTKQR